MWWNTLGAWLARWRRPKRRISIELTPEEQITVQFLTQFGSGGGDDILQEVAARRWIEPQVFVTALFNLQLKGMLRIAGRNPAGGTVYVPTPRAFEVRKLLPAEPKTSMQVYFTIDAPPRTPGPPPQPPRP